MPSRVKRSKDITIRNVRLDAETYRALSIRAYHDHVPIQNLASEMLKKQLAIEGFLKNDFDLVHREIIKTLANAASDEKLIEEARKLAMLAKEMVILNVGSERPGLKKYINSFTSFMDVNDYAVSVNEGDNNISLYAKPGICRKYSLFWAEIIRMTLASVAEVTKVEVTESSMYFECRTGAK